MPRKGTRPVKGECVIPPAIPDTALPDLILKHDLDSEASIRRYVEWQGKEEVTHAERIRTEYALGQKYDAWDVRTTKGRWWVITTPTNLYSQELFPSLDYTISFHVGVTARMMSRSRPGVEPMEAAQLPAAWRKWQQAGEALDEAEEPEDGALEVLAQDLFVVFVNQRPGAALDLMRDERTKRYFQLRDIPLDTLAEYDFDLSEKLGDVIVRDKAIDNQYGPPLMS